MTLKTKDYILKLAKENNVSYFPNYLDDFAKKITEISDNTIEDDSVLDLIVALFRKKVIDKSEMLSLSHKHLNERKLEKVVSKK
jgi:hypothetical protein